MPDTFVSHVGDVLKYGKEYWELLAGAAATVWGAVMLAKHNWRAGLATRSEVRACYDKLYLHINQNREQNTREHSELRDIIIDSLKK